MLVEEDFEKEIKVVVLGNGGVGKSSMIRRYCKGKYTDEYKKTIGVDFLEKTRWIDSIGEDVRMMVWDTAGQEEFDTITRTYYRGAGAAVLVFSTTDRASFEAIEEWKRKVEDVCGPIVMCVCQNKVDMIDESAVAPEEAEDLCRGLGLKFYRVCVKENFNVDNVFDYLVRQWSDCDRELVAAQAPAMDIREIARQTEIDRGEAVVSGAADAIASPGGKKAPAEPGHFVAPGMRHKGKKKKDEPGGEAFKLEPTKRRTGGKKSYSSRLKKSCVVS